MSVFREAYERLCRRDLPGDLVRAAFGEMLRGAWSDVEIAAFAASLRAAGAEDLVLEGAARALREVMTPLDHGLGRVLDTCGTGGDGSQTLNVSTAAAIVVAAAGMAVAKHGNRSVSSQCGSADVVEAMGIPLDLPPERLVASLVTNRLAFLMAPAHHPALRHAARARRELGVRTIFNALGPLVNPARPTHQLVGAYDDALRPLLAATLGKLGCERAWVVRSEDGLDEISPAAPTRVSILDGGAVTEIVVTPEDFGCGRLPLSVLAGGDARANAASLEAIVRGDGHPATGAVLLNAAAALVVVDAMAPRDAFERAREAIASGRARATLEAWRAGAHGGAS
jgi:anthranilate phosphoribosyltransferase